MRTERHFTLPETIDGDVGAVLAQYAQDFEAHLSSLEKEVACAAIIQAFKRYPNLKEVSFLVREAADDESVLHPARSRGVLDVDPSFQGYSLEEDVWDETCDISKLLSATLTPRIIDFYEGLRLQRKQLFTPEGTLHFADLRALRTWIEIDLK
jgi:hypothetical protein